MPPALLDAIWHTALATRVPRASWSVREGGDVLTAHDAERWYSSASMIKTFVLAAVLDAVEATRLGLDDPVCVRAEHAAGGDGILRHFARPPRLELRELLRLMVALSDNTATNAVLEALGGLETLNERLASWGYGSRMWGWIGNAGPRWSGAGIGGRPDGLAPGGVGVTSLAEHERLVGEIHARTRLSPGLADVALELLGQQLDRRALARFLPEPVAFAHKTGTVDRVRHDAGVLLPEGRVLLVGAFSEGGPEAEWVDHPACVGMGLAMAWTAEALGLDLAAPPGTPPRPSVLVAPDGNDDGWGGTVLVDGEPAGTVRVSPRAGRPRDADLALSIEPSTRGPEAALAAVDHAARAARARGALRVHGPARP